MTSDSVDAAADPDNRLPLWRDPFWRLALIVGLLSAAPLLVPTLDADSAWSYSTYVMSVPSLLLTIVVVELARRGATCRRERSFWAWTNGALATWLAEQILYVVIPWDPYVLGVELTAELLNLLYYMCVFIAAAQLPHMPSPSGPRRSPTALSVAGAAAFIFWLAAYFVVIPVTLAPEVYDTYVPSLWMYVTLDLLVVATYSRLALLAEPAGWRLTYSLIALMSAAWLVLDSIEALQWMEVLPWVEAGTAMDTLWLLPTLPLIAAARTKRAAPPALQSGSTRDLQASGIPSRSSRELLVVLATAVPILHLAGYVSGMSAPSLRVPRDASALVAVMVVGSLAIASHRRLRSERRAAEDQLVAQKDRLRALSHRLARAQEDERRDIARELHDEVGQQITGMRLTLAALRRGDQEAAASGLVDLEHRLGDLLHQVRDLSLMLRPAALDDYGPVGGVEWLIERLTSHGGLRVELSVVGEFDAMTHDAQLAAYRTVQEALTNVARHAGVDRASVTMSATDDGYRVEIDDAGSGFDVDELAVGNSCGIDGMRERADLLGGRLEIRARPGTGTRVRLILPPR